MSIFDKFMESRGYYKGQRIGEIMAAKESALGLSLLGKSEVSEYDAYLDTYADVEWVYACVYTIANAIAGLPFRLYKDEIKDGEIVKVPVIIGDAYEFLKKPNTKEPSLTWYNIMEFTIASLELTGNGYWLAEGDNQPKEIVPLIASRVRAIPETDKNAGRFVKQYEYVPAGKTAGAEGNPKYDAKAMSHFKYMNPQNYIYGLGSLSAGRMSKDTYKFMSRANLNIFRKASLTDIFLKTDKLLNDKTYDRLLKNFQAKHTGVNEAHSVGILEQGLDVKEVRQNLRDLEYNIGRRITREEICSVFGVPPLLVGILDKATYSNYKESIKIFYQLSIIPKLKRIEPTVTNLVQRYDPKLYVQADLSEIEALRDDEKVKADIALIYFNMGIPVEKINKKLNMNLDEFDGWDVGYLPVALMPITADRTVATSPSEPPKASDGLIPYRKTLGEDWKVEKWHKAISLMDKIEKGYRKIIENFFKEQAQIIARKLDTKKETDDIFIFKNLKETTEKAGGIYHSNDKFSEVYLQKAEFEVNSVLFNEEVEIKRWQKSSRKVHALSLEEAGKQELIMLGLETSFNMNSAPVINWLDKYGLDNAKDVIGSARDGIRTQLVAGLKEGESIPQLKKRLAEYYDGYKENGYKAERIARTEVLAASNRGNLEAYEQSDVVEKKGWISEPDARYTHRDAANRYNEDGAIPLNQNFHVGGDSMPAPGEGALAKENCNCRCTTFAVLKKRE